MSVRRSPAHRPVRSLVVALAGLALGSWMAGSPAAAQTDQPSAQSSAPAPQPFSVQHAFQPDDSGGAVVRACALFNRPIDADGIVLEDYVRVSPSDDTAVTARGNRLCVEGLEAGGRYVIDLRPGLQSVESDGRAAERLTDGLTSDLTVPDQNPSAGFEAGTYVLPRIGARGLPLQTVNVDSVELTLSRVPERNLIRVYQDGSVDRSLYPYEISHLRDQVGERLWTGTMPVDAPRNQRSTTVVPLDTLLSEADGAGPDALASLRPGLYALTAAIEDGDRRSWDPVATQWFVVSDLGLTLHSGDGAAEVQVRSLATAQPVAGVRVTLFGRNNEALADGRSDADGLVRFAPGLLAGTGGRAPQAVTAMLPGGADTAEHNDFTFLDLTGAPFDLSDRGVGGRPHPGPLDAFLYAERGVYRPGETAQVVALLRDSVGAAVDSLPLTLVLVAPDGTETRREVVTDAGGGSHPLTISFPRAARTGSWTVRAHVDPEAAPIGELSFLVEDVVPAKVEVGLDLTSAAYSPGEALQATVQADYLYGAPATALKAEATVTVRQDTAPYPDWPGYRFGLDDDPVAATRTRVELPETDETGRSRLDIDAIELPDTLQPLKATLRVDVFEPGGRPVIQSVALPVRHLPYALGIRPQFDDRVAENSSAGFQFIALNPGGTRIAHSDLRWRLVREDWQYRWFMQNGAWDYEITTTDEVLEAGSIDIGADAPATLARQVSYGRYRLELFDEAGSAASSVRFTAGWWVAPGLGSTPDRLVVRSDRDRYAVGDTVTLHVEAPFTGELEVVAASDRVLSRHRTTLQDGGSRIEIPVTSDWGAGAYLLATAYRPGETDATTAGGRAAPGRAVGVQWVPVDRPDRRLDVSIAVPDVTRPKTRISLPVTVDGIQPGESAHVTVAAVDEGVLQLTRFATPDPQAHVLGQRQLRVAMRDLYGRLIDDRVGPLGRPRSGGDAADLASQNAPEPTIEIVSLFSGVVPVGADGIAEVAFDIPDHNGRLRVMAVAWSPSGVGSAEADLLVRAPLVAQMSMPRFLTVGDRAALTLRLQNLDAPVGDYRVSLTTDGTGPIDLAALRVDGQDGPLRPVSLGQGADVTITAEVEAVAVGTATLSVHAAGPDGFSLDRDWALSTRPPGLRVESFEIGRLEPGHAVGFAMTTLQSRTGEPVPGTAEARFGFSRRPAIDVPGLLAGLDRYPYGCLEQTISRAIPLLYFNAVAADWGIGQTSELPAVRLQDAVDRVMAMQSPSGLFSLWPRSNYGQTPWLTAYATDFLLRAREAGYHVPDLALDRALQVLRQWSESQRGDQPQVLAAHAYAALVLSRTPEGDAPSSRYLFDARLDSLPTPTATAMVGAALANHGDLRRARQAFVAAFEQLDRPRSRPDEPIHDYGSPLRDMAAVVALAADTERRVAAFGIGDRLPRTVQKAGRLYAGRRWHSTQEQGWLLLAAHALGDASGEALSLELLQGGRPEMVSDRPEYRVMLDENGLSKGLVVRNAGDASIWRTEAISAVPAVDPGPADRGIRLERAVFTLDGEPARLDRVRQTDALVVVLSGQVTSDLREQVLLVDPLPAGFEAENPELLQGGRTEIEWLGELSRTVYEEQRDDRFVAAFDPVGDGSFRIAYVVRAVTPGTFVYPAAVAEHMYAPDQRGKTGAGSVAVLPYF